MAGKCIVIRAHIVDTHGCEGPEFNQTISIPIPKIDQHLAVDLNQRTSVSYYMLYILKTILINYAQYLIIIIINIFSTTCR